MNSAITPRSRARNTGNTGARYRLLITAVIRQAVKDNAVDFLETRTGKSYCAAVGVDPEKLSGKIGAFRLALEHLKDEEENGL